MTTSSQTSADLKNIIDILDQRIHELTSQPNAATHEVGHLTALRDQAASLAVAA